MNLKISFSAALTALPAVFFFFWSMTHTYLSYVQVYIHTNVSGWWEDDISKLIAIDGTLIVFISSGLAILNFSGLPVPRRLYKILVSLLFLIISAVIYSSIYFLIFVKMGLPFIFDFFLL